MRIALTGNPNSGKTTMYNALTGRNEKIGNWAGVTVDRKESPIKKDHYDGAKELIAVDLPGAYSMSPFTSEESITSGYVKNEHPDAIINIVDATNLSRSLFFTTQLLELGGLARAVGALEYDKLAVHAYASPFLSGRMRWPAAFTRTRGSLAMRPMRFGSFFRR